MRLHLLPVAVLGVAVIGLAGCAPMSDRADAEPRAEKVYRTGSNIPVRDPRVASEVKDVKLGDAPLTRSTMPNLPGGGH